MKSKFLLPLLSSLSIVPAVTLVTSCKNDGSDAEKIVDAIINPTKITTPVQITKTFKESLQGLNQEQLNNELIYDLFGSFVQDNAYNLGTGINFAKLYQEDKVQVKTNVTKTSLSFNSDKTKLVANFLGYVSFVFADKYSDTFRKNDYVMLTFDIYDQEVTIDEDNCALKYEIKSSPFDNPCVGFAKIRYNGGREVMQYFKSINTKDWAIRNSHNWVK